MRYRTAFSLLTDYIVPVKMFSAIRQSSRSSSSALRAARTATPSPRVVRPTAFVRTLISESNPFCPCINAQVLTYPPAKRYTEDHEAVVYDDQTQIGTVSITDYAQKSLGDVVYVELPQEGSDIVQGGKSRITHLLRPSRRQTAIHADQIGAVESVKAASDIVSACLYVCGTASDTRTIVRACVRKGRGD